jgi:hypothetical protein
MPMKLVGRFASAANACSPVYRMTRKTVNQPDDIPPLSMLSDFIVASYRPGDVVLIAMSHPTNFAIVHHDVVNYQWLRLVFPFYCPTFFLGTSIKFFISPLSFSRPLYTSSLLEGYLSRLCISITLVWSLVQPGSRESMKLLFPRVSYAVPFWRACPGTGCAPVFRQFCFPWNEVSARR